MKISTAPFATYRKPTLATNGMVATSQPLAAQAGLEVLRAGGNAIDAAVATAAALTVVEPTSNGIGGDLFALVWDGDKLHGLNASGRAPASWSADDYRAQGHQEVPPDGWSAITVPGAPAGWRSLTDRFGTMPLSRLVENGAVYAEEGYPVSPTVADLWAAAGRRFLALKGEEFAGWGQTFAPGGAVPQAGQRWASPGHAASLRSIGATNAESFYRGELAEQITAFAKRTGGALSADDLANHTNDWVEPICVSYRGHEVWEIPPSGQGIAALMALGMLEGFDIASQPQISAQNWHWRIEAMKLAFADAHRYVADPQVVSVPTEGLLDREYLASRRALIGDRAIPRSPGMPKGGTIYLCTADRDGRMVSLIQSNFHGFGSGVVVPGAGISLHNRGIGFTLEANHPNELAGGKRPFHTIIPAFLTRGGRPVGPFGVMGAPMQPQGHLQVMLGTIDYGLNPQAALDAPRWRFLEGNETVVEAETPQSVYRGLVARGHALMEPSERYAFGRGQIIWQLEDGVYVGGSEPRADGCVAAY